MNKNQKYNFDELAQSSLSTVHMSSPLQKTDKSLKPHERAHYDWYLSNPFEQTSPKFTENKGSNISFLQRTNHALTSEIDNSGWITNPRNKTNLENRSNFRSRDKELTKQISVKNRQETFRNPAQNFSFLQPRATNRALKEIGNKIHDNDQNEKDTLSDLTKSNIIDNAVTNNEYLKRNPSKETTKKKYELMLNDYLNNNDKRMSRDLPRERVENKIKRFKEFINREDTFRVDSKYNNQENPLNFKPRRFEEKENEFERCEFSDINPKSYLNKEYNYSSELHTKEERVKTYEAPKRLYCENDFKKTNENIKNKEIENLKQQFESQRIKTREENLKYHHSLQNNLKFENKLVSPPKESEIKDACQYNENKLRSTFYDNEIENKEDYQQCLYSYKHYPQKFPKVKQCENTQSEEEYCEHEQSSEKPPSPVKMVSKPPIYRKTKRSSGSSQTPDQEPSSDKDKESDKKECEDEEQDCVDENLKDVAESLCGIRRNIQNKQSYEYSNLEGRPMIYERITIEQLIEWNQILEETSKEELDCASMDYKNEILKLASLISDVLSPDSV